MPKAIIILFIIPALFSVCWCMYRDIQIEKQYTGDLRNRVVGARLQKDGRPPYFYKWKNTDGIRYYDPQNFDTLRVANITATPFFHELFYPFTDLPQRTISKIWLVIEYLLLIITTAIAVSFAKNKVQKYAVCITGLVFLYSNAWIAHIAAGQLYLFIPFLSMLFCYFLTKNENNVFAFFAGLSAAVIVLVRPNTIFFLLPFLLLANKFQLKYKAVLFISIFLVFIYILGSSNNRLFWEDYRAAMSEQVKSHQGLGAAFQQNERDPGFIKWEGWDMNEVAVAASRFPFFSKQEHGNVFVIIHHSIHKKLPVWILATSSLILLLLFIFFFYKKYKHSSLFNLQYISLFSFCGYMITDFFSPIHRFQYNGVQWLFPLLVLSSLFHKSNTPIYIGVMAGLLLNSLNFSLLPMEQSLGEYIIFLFLIIFIFKNKLQTSA